MNVEFIQALNELVKDRGIDRDVLLETIETALTSAYKKNFGSAQNVRVDLNRTTGDIKVYSQRLVVDESDLYDNFLEIELSEARKINPNYELGDKVEYEVTPSDFGRIAAQTAKQIVVQKIREAEREKTYNEFLEKQDEIVTGEISRVSNRDGKQVVFVQLGKTEGILLSNEQMPNDEYKIGKFMKFYLVDVNKTNKNPQVLLSRANVGLVKRLFEMQVPEIQNGTVQIKSMSREAGSRTKMAVKSTNPNVDPIGACIGTQFTRVKNIVSELGNEKIDIVKYSDDPAEFILNSLSPSKVVEVFVNKKTNSAVVIVPDYQLSLAIGKGGQNVRLAARLTNWKIDIKPESEFSVADKIELLEQIKVDNEAYEAEMMLAMEQAQKEAEELDRYVYDKEDEDAAKIPVHMDVEIEESESSKYMYDREDEDATKVPVHMDVEIDEEDSKRYVYDVGFDTDVDELDYEEDDFSDDPELDYSDIEHLDCSYIDHDAISDFDDSIEGIDEAQFKMFEEDIEL